MNKFFLSWLTGVLVVGDYILPKKYEKECLDWRNMRLTELSVFLNGHQYPNLYLNLNLNLINWKFGENFVKWQKEVFLLRNLECKMCLKLTTSFLSQNLNKMIPQNKVFYTNIKILFEKKTNSRIRFRLHKDNPNLQPVKMALKGCRIVLVLKIKWVVVFVFGMS